MSVLTVHWDSRLLRAVLTVTVKFYVLCLLTAAAYTIYVLARTVSRVRRVHRDVASTAAARVKCRLIEMNRVIENLRQFHTLPFFLFGIFTIRSVPVQGCLSVLTFEKGGSAAYPSPHLYIGMSPLYRS